MGTLAQTRKTFDSTLQFVIGFVFRFVTAVFFIGRGRCARVVIVFVVARLVALRSLVVTEIVIGKIYGRSLVTLRLNRFRSSAVE
jgi:hypothetical protein